jgi:hypothetical protein
MSSVVIRNAEGAGKVVEHITQKMIDNHLTLKRRLEASATMLRNSLKLGATVEEGPGKAYLDKGSDCKPNWRAALLEKCGKAVVDAVRAATPRTEYTRLRVEKPKK